MADGIEWTEEHHKGKALLTKRKRSYSPKVDLLPLKSYCDLSQNEVDRVQSALEAASKLAIKKNYSKAKQKVESPAKSLKKNVQVQEVIKTKKETSKIRKQDFKPKMTDLKTAENVTKPQKKEECPCKIKQKDLRKEESQAPGTSQEPVDIKKNRRLQTALKLLDFVEGKCDGSDSDWSIGSATPSSECLEAVSEGGTRSTQRLQAMQDLSPRDYFGFCRDCRSRCRSCGRRPSAVAIAKNRKG
ncbi:uncharacterized protein LOC108033467 [Drosophila biarmipes]|uniref:uncharacterized protein LOC108033467 n=1 Tax=Drosophila biarmipes TaxID=125945 RepID=UPI001CDA6E1C|nr:uncharacterized protein LOC108033467 [Drosophila biarmipes]